MHVALTDLWLAILIASVCVFFASAIIWMMLPYHKKDIQFMPNEEEFTGAITPMNITPGLYMFPNCQDARDMKSEEFQAKWKAGPWGTITIQPKQPNFAINLLRTFLSYLVITIIVAYLAGLALPMGADYMEVFQVVAIAGILGHCMGGMANDFFLGKPTRFIITGFIDGVIFALITAGIIASMWPGAPSGLEGTLMVNP
jgi:hypothetical protein